MQTLFIWLAVLAAVCWALGAYNRLVRLRAAVRSGFAAVDDTMRAECAQLLTQAPAGLDAAAVEEPAEEGQQPPSAEGAADGVAGKDEAGNASEAWRSCVAAAQQLDAALAQARRDPVDVAARAMVSAAYQVFEQAVGRVRSDGVYADSRLNENEGGLIPSDWMNWAQLEVKLAEAIGAFNDGVGAYNVAIHTWPARILAMFLGFRDAGPLSGLRHTP
jgi:LemA protein